MHEHVQIDIPLLVIGLLLVATLAAFLSGVFPYPFGFFILCFALLGRYLYLRGRKGLQQIRSASNDDDNTDTQNHINDTD